MIDKIMGSDKLYKDNNNTTITNYFSSFTFINNL